MALAYKKGKNFERQVEEILIHKSVEYQKQKRIKGFGKRWLVDFYLPQYKTIIECKNISSSNLRRELRLDCLKFLDIYNRHLNMRFVLVFPKPNFIMSAFVRFCTAYKIKLTRITTLADDLDKKVQDVNERYGQLTTPKTRAIKLIKDADKEGITKTIIHDKLGWRGKTNSVPLETSELAKYGIVKSVLSPRRYFTQENYQGSNEFELIQDLRKHHLDYSDKTLAKKYGVTLSQVRRLRAGKLGLTKISGWYWKRPENFTLSEFTTS